MTGMKQLDVKPQIISFTDTETTGLDPFDDEIIQIEPTEKRNDPLRKTIVVKDPVE